LSFLEINNLSVGYEQSIIKDINLKAEKNELIAVIGKNGTGKSTLLKTISGVLKKISGQIFIDSVNTSSLPVGQLASKIGFSAISDISALNLSVYDIVRLGRIPHTSLLGKLKPKDLEAINYAIKQTGLENIKYKEISKISDGQRQRAFIARLIAQQTDILLFDEPTAFLDVEGKHKIAYLFRQIAKCNNKTIIFSTHDFKIALQNADIIWLFIEDKIVAAAPEDIVLQGYFQKLFSDETINFNNFTADFDVKKQIIGDICIINNSSELRKNWTIKALERIGFFQNEKSDRKINITDNSWILSINNQQLEFFSIYNLLKKLENA